MSLPEFGVRKPVTNLMIFSGIIVIALYSLGHLGVDLMPEIEPPAITVISTYSGANPEDIESKVTEPLENQLATTPGIDKITARCLEGISLITLKFNWGTNLDEASNDIRDRIDRAKKFLPDIPDEMDEPSIFKFNTAMIPILFVGFSADRSYPDLYDLIDKRIVDDLKQIPGVGTLTLQGGSSGRSTSGSTGGASRRTVSPSSTSRNCWGRRTSRSRPAASSTASPTTSSGCRASS